MERGGIAMNQCYPKYKQCVGGTKSYPCRLYAKSGERERRREIEKEGRESVLLLVEQKLKIESKGERR